MGNLASCVDNAELGSLLQRRRRIGRDAYEVDLSSVLATILDKANAFVPSEAGTLFIDDPAGRLGARADKELVFVATFGDAGTKLLGQRVLASKGIVGDVYQTGRSHRSVNPAADVNFCRDFDAKTTYQTRSVLCVPLRLEETVVGAIQLLNRLGEESFSDKDLQLLEIFAQTISSSVANALDAQQAKAMAIRDELTGLGNDRYLHYLVTRAITTALADGTDCSLIFLDIDHFKGVNDGRGHLTGSRVLRELGILLADLATSDSQACRYGGDEFVVILERTSVAATAHYAEAIRQAVDDHVFAAHADPHDPVSYPALGLTDLSCSVGYASLREHLLVGRADADPVRLKNELIRRADQAMYAAKSNGRNRVEADPVAVPT